MVKESITGIYNHAWMCVIMTYFVNIEFYNISNDSSMYLSLNLRFCSSGDFPLIKGAMTRAAHAEAKVA